MRTAILLTPALALAAASAAPAQLKPGIAAPEISARQWFNEPPGTSLAALRGRVVYIEFWATW